MSDLAQAVQREIEDLHVFFVEWFNGSADRDSYEERFVSHFDKGVHFIPPSGVLVDYEQLVAMMRDAYGTNPDFAIAIRDVNVWHVTNEQIVVSYTEWQRNSHDTEEPNNGRITSAVLSTEQPFRWLHVQETMLPAEVQAAGPYDF